MPAWHIFIFGLLCSNVFLLFPSLFLLLALHMQQPALVFLEAEHCLFDRIEGQQQRGRAVPSEVSSEHNTTSTHTPSPKSVPPSLPSSPRWRQVAWLRLWARSQPSLPPDTSCIYSAGAGVWHGSDDTVTLATCSHSASGIVNNSECSIFTKGTLKYVHLATSVCDFRCYSSFLMDL